MAQGLLEGGAYLRSGGYNWQQGISELSLQFQNCFRTNYLFSK